MIGNFDGSNANKFQMTMGLNGGKLAVGSMTKKDQHPGGAMSLLDQKVSFLTINDILGAKKILYTSLDQEMQLLNKATD